MMSLRFEVDRSIELGIVLRDGLLVLAVLPFWVPVLENDICATGLQQLFEEIYWLMGSLAVPICVCSCVFEFSCLLDFVSDGR
jgi:hypothetical protein